MNHYVLIINNNNCTLLSTENIFRTINLEALL